jgi:sugar phosphate permease
MKLTMADTPHQDSDNRCPPLTKAYSLLAVLIVSYMGIYLCRKNLSVAAPLLQSAWGLTKSQLGVVASVSTLAYACGKILLGPVVDRTGGRTCLLSSMALVALFGLAGAVSPSLLFLTVAYSANRFCGAASWGSMVKLVPEWFPKPRLTMAMGWLSLSFVFGGACAVSFAGWLARCSADNWQVIMGVPSFVLMLLIVLARYSWRAAGATDQSAHSCMAQSAVHTAKPASFASLLAHRQFLIVCALSFTLTFMREAFNFWTVDFIKTEGGSQVSSQAAALLSTPFDICGALGILWLGWLFNDLSGRRRTAWLVALLLSLTTLLFCLPDLFHQGLWVAAIAIGLIGFLIYGPYSLLAGVLAVEVKGPEYAATVAGWVDGIGYLAGVLSGQFFGYLLEIGGYRLGFQSMAVITLCSAALCLFLNPMQRSTNDGAPTEMALKEKTT